MPKPRSGSLHADVIATAADQRRVDRPRASRTKKSPNETLDSVRRDRLELTTLLESTAHGIVRTDLDGRCTYINRAGAEMLGYEPAEIVGQSMHNLSHSRRPDGSPYPAEECPHWVASQSGLAVTPAEEVFWRRDGTSFPVQFTSSPIHQDGRVTGLVVSLTDISKRREIDEARQASEARYRTIVEFAHEGVWIVDAEHRTTFVNRHLADMLGYTPDEMLGRPFFSFMDQDARAVAEAGLDRKRDGLSKQLEFRYRRRDGTELWTIVSANPLTDETGRYIGSLAMVTDITERKRSEAASARREGQLAEAQRLAQLGSWEWDLASGGLSWSDEHYRIFGLEPQTAQLPYGAGLSYIHPEDVERVQTMLNATADTGAPFDGLFRILRPDGGLRVIHSRAILIRDGSDRPARIVGTAQDITEHQQTEEALRASESELLALFAAMTEVVLVLDHQGRYLRIAPTSPALLARPPEELLGKTIHEVLPPADANVIQQYISRALETQQAVPVDYQTRMGDRDVWFDGTASPISKDSVFWIARDSTTRKLAEQNRSRLAAIVDSSEDAIISKTLDGRVTSWNAAAERLYGYTAREAMGQSSDLIVPPERRNELRAIMRRVRQGVRVEHQDTVRRRKNGSLVSVAVTVSLVRDESGTAIGISTIARDITNRELAVVVLRETNQKLSSALEDLSRAQRQMVQQERLAALGEMASGIAHDFNNALSPVVAYSELLLTRPNALDDKEKARSYLQYILTAGQDAANVVSRLREFYRQREPGTGHEPVKLNIIVAQAASLTSPRWKDQAQANGLDLRLIVMPGPVPPILGDEAELREMLTNLIFNAVDAMPADGTITITSRADGEHVVLAVGDTGTGMTEEVRQHCLEPFFTTKGQHGTGLGLGMVYGIVHRHGGTVGIESAPGEGTTVTIRLPFAGPSNSEAATPVPEVLAASPLHILVVEDEVLVRQGLLEYLAIDGHRVASADNGHEALEELRLARFDLVVTDRSMPGLSGDELAVAIKHASPDLPVIMLTGFGDLMTAAGECPAGVDLVLCKPVRLAPLREAIQQVTSPQAAGSRIPSGLVLC